MAHFRKRRAVNVENVRSSNLLPLSRQSGPYNNWIRGLRRRLIGLYRYSIFEATEIAIGNARKEGGLVDMGFRCVIFREANEKDNTCEILYMGGEDRSRPIDGELGLLPYPDM